MALQSQEEKKRYLGEGVYAEIVDGRVILTIENGVTKPVQRIAMNQTTLEGLVIYSRLKRLLSL